MSNFKPGDIVVCTEVHSPGVNYIKVNKTYIVSNYGFFKPVLGNVWVNGHEVLSGVSEKSGVFKKI